MPGSRPKPRPWTKRGVGWWLKSTRGKRNPPGKKPSRKARPQRSEGGRPKPPLRKQCAPESRQTKKHGLLRRPRRKLKPRPLKKPRPEPKRTPKPNGQRRPGPKQKKTLRPSRKRGNRPMSGPGKKQKPE